MAVLLPQWAAQDGRAGASADDANVQVWPNTASGEYKTNQSGVAPRAATTITACPDFETNLTCLVELNGVNYFIPFNTSVTVPNMIYQVVVSASASGWRVS